MDLLLKMNSRNLPVLLETLKGLESETEPSHDVLGRMFDTCLKIHDLVEDSDLSSNEKEFEEAVQVCIKYLEKCTRMVNELDLFSSNEAIEEVETASIKYLMLPALLANLNLSKQSKELPKRVGFLEISEVYFKDFLLRCKNYELSKKQLVNNYEDELLEDYSSENGGLPRQTIADLAAQRDSKIQIYRLRKELKTREDELKPALDRADAEECIREYYLVIIERWILTAVEELKNIKSEKSVLGCMIRKKQEYSNGFSPKTNQVKPLKPIIITKNEIQKKVFGLGYPSIPVMTIDDFYRQRFEKMVKEHNNSSESMQASAMMGDSMDEAAEKEQLMDRDDPAALHQARAWDDWKDDNARGSGNRHNKG